MKGTKHSQASFSDFQGAQEHGASNFSNLLAFVKTNTVQKRFIQGEPCLIFSNFNYIIIIIVAVSFRFCFFATG